MIPTLPMLTKTGWFQWALVEIFFFFSFIMIHRSSVWSVVSWSQNLEIPPCLSIFWRSILSFHEFELINLLDYSINSAIYRPFFGKQFSQDVSLTCSWDVQIVKLFGWKKWGAWSRRWNLYFFSRCRSMNLLGWRGMNMQALGPIFIPSRSFRYFRHQSMPDKNHSKHDQSPGSDDKKNPTQYWLNNGFWDFLGYSYWKHRIFLTDIKNFGKDIN